jgi:hypothetical protein
MTKIITDTAEAEKKQRLKRKLILILQSEDQKSLKITGEPEKPNE